MPPETLSFEELFDGLDAAPRFVAELERLGLLHVVARDGAGRALYAAEAREQLQKVMELVHLGYEPKDIAAIARKMGLPTQRRRLFQRRATLLARGKLADRTGLPEELLASWETHGILEPRMTTQGGEPLYDGEQADRLLALSDLLAFGWSTQAIASWIATTRDLAQLEARLPRKGAAPALDETERAQLLEAAQVVRELRRRVEALRAGVRRWDKLLEAWEKRTGRLEKAWATEPQAARSKRRRPANTRRRLETGE